MAKSETRKPTSFDVARLAGVSRSAVSRAFTPGGAIADTTREKVTKAASELGYRVNSLARGLQQTHSGIVGLVASRLDTPFRSRQVRLLSEALTSEGLKPILITAERPDNVDSLIESLLGYSIAGMIFTSDSPTRALIEDCGRLGLPVVLINRAGVSNWGDRVVADNEAAGELAAQILIESGARHLGCLLPQSGTFSVSGRAKAFMKAVKKRGFQAEVFCAADQSYDDARAEINAIGTKAISRLDGLFCSTDLMALGALDALRIDLGLKVPDQIQVLGFDDIDQASWGSYNLSTIRQDVEGQTEMAVRLLLERIENGDLENRVEHQPLETVLRGTTRHD